MANIFTSASTQFVLEHQQRRPSHVEFRDNPHPPRHVNHYNVHYLDPPHLHHHRRASHDTAHFQHLESHHHHHRRASHETPRIHIREVVRASHETPHIHIIEVGRASHETPLVHIKEVMYILILHVPTVYMLTFMCG